MNRSPVFAIVFILLAATRMTLAEPNETTLPDDAVAHRDVVYLQRPSGPVKLDVFTPPGDGPFPVVLWIHGGAWKTGDKAMWPHMNFVVRDGYAVVNVEYRFSQVAPFPAQIDDVTAALAYIAAHAAEYKLDAERIAVTGESAGGHLASLLGMSRPASTTQPAGRVRAVIDLFGPTDLATVHLPENPPGTIEQLLGGSLDTRPELVRDGSPMNHVAKDNPPFLILHGTKDALVSPTQSQHFADALKAAGVSVELVMVEGAPHAGPTFWTEPMRAKMTAFLKSHL
ncbi:MAG: peptidase prolyl oligopeptidase active site domain protein [Phycisphaerales bacterium]|nr:peptidase prolyl oligopeptidase active site domain protein [Phycisphaerales bacterium]